MIIEMAKNRMLSRYPNRMTRPILTNRNPHQNKRKDRDIVKRSKYAVAEIAVANKLQAKRDQKVRVKEKKCGKLSRVTANKQQEKKQV